MSNVFSMKIPPLYGLNIADCRKTLSNQSIIIMIHYQRQVIVYYCKKNL